MAGIQYTVGLLDRMSGPARQASQSVTALGSSLRVAKADLAAFQGQLSRAKALGDIEGYRRYTAAVADAQRQVYDLTRQSEGLGSRLGAGGLAPRLGTTVAVVAIATAALGGMAEAYGKLAETVLRAANAEQAFNRQSLSAYTALGGSEAAGQRTYAVVENLAKTLPIAKEQLAEWTKTLQSAGITDTGVLRKGLSALAGSQALMGNEGAETLISTLRRVQEAVETGRGLKLADRQLAQLAKTGVNVTDVAGEMGVSVQQLQQQLKAGTQDAGAFGTALLNAIDKKGRGPLKAMWADLDTLEKKGREFAQNFFQDVNLTPAIDAMQRFFSLLDQSTAAGNDLESGITKGVNGIVKAFGKITDATTIAYLKIATFALNVDTELLKVDYRLRHIGDYLTSLPSRIQGLMHGQTGALDFPEPPSAPGAPQKGKQALYTAAGAVARARALGAYTPAELQEAGDKLSDSLAAGIKQGLITKEEGVYLQGIALGKAAVAGAKAGAQVHSPSRATFWVGSQVGIGMGLGMRASVGHVTRAAAYVGESATRAGVYLRAFERDRRGEPFSRVMGGGGGVRVDRAEVNITAPSGVTDATDLSAYGLSIALERQQLMGGA